VDFSMFFTQLSVGCLGLTPVVPWRSVGKGYYVMMLAIALALLPVAWLFRASTPGGFPAPGELALDARGATTVLFGAYGIAAMLALAAFLAWGGDRGFGITLVAAALGWAAVAADGVRAAGAAQGPAAVPALLVGNYLAGAGLLGSVLGAMLLGHWYLVVRDLPARPLKALTGLLFAFLLARLAATGAAFALDPGGGATVVRRWAIPVIVYGLFSLGSPLAMSWMIRGTVAIRATQSATGILYGVVVFILMGEAAGRYVLIQTGFPL